MCLPIYLPMWHRELTDMLVVLSEILHNEGLELILVIPSSLRG